MKHDLEEFESQHPWDKYDVTEGDNVVVVYYTSRHTDTTEPLVNALAGEIGCSPWDKHLMLFLDENASVLIPHAAIVSIQTVGNLCTED